MCKALELMGTAGCPCMCSAGSCVGHDSGVPVRRCLQQLEAVLKRLTSTQAQCCCSSVPHQSGGRRAA
eukprot:4321023-Prymnesium_polylepis.1